MSKIEKLIGKFLGKPKDISFVDVETLLDFFGYTEKHRGTGSHRVFTKAGELPVIIPTIKGRNVKGAYIQMIIERLGLEDYHESER